MYTRDIGKQAAILDAVKEKCAEVSRLGFTKDTTSFELGYIQAHRDMLTRIQTRENQ